jgi:thymidylate synthase ThyX
LGDSELTKGERERLRPYVSNLDGPVFALTNLPETVKGALFARYSRSPKSLRRLLIDEFLPDDSGAGATNEGPGGEQAEALYDRVLAQYGDDSVAQLGAVHLAVEGASNILTKVLQWGRLASYLEQSTRYIAYADQPGGYYRYHRPAGVMADTALAGRYVTVMDGAFDAYAGLIEPMAAFWERETPDDGTPPPARARAIRARALDSLRGMLPAATTSNTGIFASGQAYEAMIIRMAAHPLSEARTCAAQMLTELRTVIPAFLTRTDRPDRGGAHSAYLAETAAATAEHATRHLTSLAGSAPTPAQVTLVDFDPDGEERVVAHALWAASGADLATARAVARQMSPADRRDVLGAYAGARADRRQRPGRALETTTYTFEIVCDYGAYRDLQRHRLLSLQAQALTPHLGWDLPNELAEAGHAERYVQVQADSAALYAELLAATPSDAAYAVSLAHRVRFTMVMNAREAMHVIELRSQPQGHPSYRRVAQQMHQLIAAQAGHTQIAAMMSFVDTSEPAAGRMAAERRLAARRGEALG